MRHYKTGSRWATPQRKFTGAWRRNPWINAVVSRFAPSLHDDASADSLHKAAVAIWEDEGGSLGTHRGIR